MAPIVRAMTNQYRWRNVCNADPLLTVALPNGMRLSCAAQIWLSQMQFYR